MCCVREDGYILSIGVFPKRSVTFTEFSEFRETDNHKRWLGVGARILLLNDIFLSLNLLNSVKTFRKNFITVLSTRKFSFLVCTGYVLKHFLEERFQIWQECIDRFLLKLHRNVTVKPKSHRQNMKLNTRDIELFLLNFHQKSSALCL